MSGERKILGAVIAGGLSRRFGSDKALALIGGRPMMSHVIEALRPQVAEVVICGRTWPGMRTLADRREGGLGPLAGLEAALHDATHQGFAAVLSVPVDVLPLPVDLAERLQDAGPAVLQHQHMVGYWPIECLEPLGRYISSGGRAVRGWVAEADARMVTEPFRIENINFPDDLTHLVSPWNC